MMRGHSKGLLTQTGADWKRMREVLNQRMLKPREVMQFADPLNAVVTELMGHVRARRGHGAAAAVFPLPDVAQLFYRFAFEVCEDVRDDARARRGTSSAKNAGRPRSLRPHQPLAA
ncbi:sterol 26-hydroxylase, mitochondrial-like [Lampetra fluviatilis]